MGLKPIFEQERCFFKEKSGIELPTDCFGGSICIATSNGTTYSKNDWIKRNNFIPTDYADTLAKKNDVDNSLQIVNNNISSNFTTLNNSINANIQTVTETINANKVDIDDRVSNLQSEVGNNISRLDGKDADLRDYYDRQIEIKLGTIEAFETVTNKETTYTLEGERKISSQYVLGPAETAEVIPGVGTVLGILESKWGFLFLIVLLLIILPP